MSFHDLTKEQRTEAIAIVARHFNNGRRAWTPSHLHSVVKGIKPETGFEWDFEIVDMAVRQQYVCTYIGKTWDDYHRIIAPKYEMGSKKRSDLYLFGSILQNLALLDPRNLLEVKLAEAQVGMLNQINAGLSKEDRRKVLQFFCPQKDSDKAVKPIVDRLIKETYRAFLANVRMYVGQLFSYCHDKEKGIWVDAMFLGAKKSRSSLCVMCPKTGEEFEIKYTAGDMPTVNCRQILTHL